MAGTGLYFCESLHFPLKSMRVFSLTQNLRVYKQELASIILYRLDLTVLVIAEADKFILEMAVCTRSIHLCYCKINVQ